MTMIRTIDPIIDVPNNEDVPNNVVVVVVSNGGVPLLVPVVHI